MKKRRSGYARILASLAAAVLAQPTVADTLEMRDGTVIEGRFLGGSRNNLRFQVGGDIKLYPLSGALIISFDEVRPAPVPVVGKTPDDTQRRTVIVAAGSTLAVRIRDALDTDATKNGSGFRAVLATELRVHGILVAPEEAEVWGRVVKLETQSDTKDLPVLELTGLHIDGRLYPIRTEARKISALGTGGSVVAAGTELEFVLQVPFGVQIPAK